MAKKLTELFKDAIAKADTPEGRRALREEREWSGPCPRCGGVDRFHVRPGSR